MSFLNERTDRRTAGVPARLPSFSRRAGSAVKLEGSNAEGISKREAPMKPMMSHSKEAKPLKTTRIGGVEVVWEYGGTSDLNLSPLTKL